MYGKGKQNNNPKPEGFLTYTHNKDVCKQRVYNNR